MGDATRLTSPHVRGALAGMLVSVPAAVIASDSVLRDRIVPHALAAFCAVELTGRHNQLHENLHQRHSYVQLLNSLMKQPFAAMSLLAQWRDHPGVTIVRLACNLFCRAPADITRSVSSICCWET